MNRIKAIFLLVAILLPLSASAKKIEKDEIDEFTGYRTVYTSWESLCGKEIHIRFRQQNNRQFLDFKMFYNGAIVIGEGDKLMFKSTTDNIGKFSSVRTYHGESGAGAVNIMGSGAWGIYASYEGDLSYFADNIIRLLRIYTVDSYIDEEINEGGGKSICELYGIFARALNPDAETAIASYKLTYLKKGVNDSQTPQEQGGYSEVQGGVGVQNRRKDPVQTNCEKVEHGRIKPHISDLLSEGNTQA